MAPGYLLLMSIVIVPTFVTFCLRIGSHFSEYRRIKRGRDLCIDYKATLFGITVNTKNLPLFSFDQFLKFVNLNPEVWYFLDKSDNDITVPCRIEKIPNPDYNGYNAQYKILSNPIFFKTFIDYMRYIHWCKKMIKEKRKFNNNKELRENTESFCKAVQRDIDAAHVELEKAVAATEKLIKEQSIDDRSSVVIQTAINGVEKLVEVGLRR